MDDEEIDNWDVRAWIAEHPAREEDERVKYNLYQREMRKLNPDRVKKYQRKHALKGKYSLTEQEYQALLEKQGGHCALCPATTNGYKTQRLGVDHCHETGKIRGLLCVRCNSAIATLGDTVESLMRAVEYLK